MAESLLERIREEFPQAEDLAFRRIFARGHTIFFEKARGKKLLPQFTEELVFAALFLAKTYVAQAGAELILTTQEQKLLRGFLIPPIGT